MNKWKRFNLIIYCYRFVLERTRGSDLLIAGDSMMAQASVADKYDFDDGYIKKTKSPTLSDRKIIMSSSPSLPFMSCRFSIETSGIRAFDGADSKASLK